ncbi:alpha/beta fold hydrolase [Sulfitobacter sp. JB4-11]|uniref:alpha/beta fold hydrolase n=1 Tax=Sulfitobacter rhodophyticola TaxID=3238304 RepID=UPI0035118F39
MATFTTSDGLTLYYEDEGDGLPILCLPGLTRTTADFEYVTPRLAGNRVIRMDYRGRGRSEFDPTWENYNVQVEGRDVMELLAHLGLDKAAILGTSRGGIIAMGLAALAKDHLLGVALNDIGPALDPKGIDFILVYLGRNPAAKTHAEAAAALQHVFSDFRDVPPERWLREAQKNYTETENGLQITYDPKLRDAVEQEREKPMPDLWPFFDAMDGLPLACIRGANSGLFTQETLSEMQKRRPDMFAAVVPDRGHVPFLDEPEAVSALHRWVEAMK